MTCELIAKRIAIPMSAQCVCVCVCEWVCVCQPCPLLEALGIAKACTVLHCALRECFDYVVQAEDVELFDFFDIFDIIDIFLYL